MSLIEDQHALRQHHDHFHDVLDDDNRDAHFVDAAHQRDRFLQFGRSQAGKRFVEQHQARRGGEHAGDLQPLAAGRAERTGALVGEWLKAGELDDLARVHERVAAMRMAQERADHHVVEHGHVLEGRRHLERAADAKPRVPFRRGARDILPREKNLPGARRHVAGQAIEKRRLAGAIRADQADDLVILNRNVGVRHGAEGAEGLGHFFRFKQQSHASSAAA